MVLISRPEVLRPIEDPGGSQKTTRGVSPYIGRLISAHLQSPAAAGEADQWSEYRPRLIRWRWSLKQTQRFSGTGQQVCTGWGVTDESSVLK